MQPAVVGTEMEMKLVQLDNEEFDRIAAQALLEAGYTAMDIWDYGRRLAADVDARLPMVIGVLDRAMHIGVKSTVRLVDNGEKKIQVIKTLREHLGLGLKDAKHLSDSVPTRFDVDSEYKAAALVKDLVALGAKASCDSVGIDAMAAAIRGGGR